jgi:O-antigen/teichoic acid export membrane protein
MVLVRLLGWLALLVLCRAVVPSPISSGRERVSGFRELLSFGGWISLINVANTLFTYADRWALGIWASLAAVTYYTVPFEVATKLWIIPAAIAGAMFPSFCRVSGRASLRELRTLLIFGTGYTMTLSFIPTIALVVFAEEVLIVWLGHEFGQHSTTVFQILLIGTFVNSLAHTSVTLLQGRGRPQWIAFLLLAELPLFLIALWIFVPMLGGKGAALVWTVRVAIDAGVLCFLASRCVNEGARALSALGAPLVVFLSALVFGATLTSLAAKLLFCGAGIILFSAAIFQLSYWARVQGESPA